MSEMITDSGLKYEETTSSDGALAENGQTVSVHYTGWLEDGTKFDSSKDAMIHSSSSSVPVASSRAGMKVSPAWRLAACAS